MLRFDYSSVEPTWSQKVRLGVAVEGKRRMELLKESLEQKESA